MKFTVSQSSLMKALSVVAKGMGNNSTLPILSGIYLKAENGTVELQTNNLSISIRHVVAANVEEPGETVVSGKILLNIVKTLSDSAVTFEETGNMVTISCDKSTFRLNTLSARDWPAWSELEPERTIELPSALLAKMVDKVYRVTSKEPTRQFLQGIQMFLFGHDRVNLPALPVQFRKEPLEILIGIFPDSFSVPCAVFLMTDCQLHVTVPRKNKLEILDCLRRFRLILAVQRTFRRVEKYHFETLSLHVVHRQIHSFFRTHRRHIDAEHIYFSKRMFFHALWSFPDVLFSLPPFYRAESVSKL